MREMISAAHPIKLWVDVGGVDVVPVESAAYDQLRRVADLPIIAGHIAVMPDVHWGNGATVGSVIPTRGAIIPAAVGVDIGCGMVAQKTGLRAEDLPDNLNSLRLAIEAAVPHGGPGVKGSWAEEGYRRPPAYGEAFSRRLAPAFDEVASYHGELSEAVARNQIGTLGGGNHFIEICLDESDYVWIMLHSGSRGPGNKIGTRFIEKAKEQIAKRDVKLVDTALAWLADGTPEFEQYVTCLQWAQDYARMNRELMMLSVKAALGRVVPKLLHLADDPTTAVNCHHNYVARERHFGEVVWLTRKGAVDASLGKLGIIPGAMGRRSYIVRGKGNPDSFNSCSHGAGRAMSRGQAKRTFTLEDHKRETAGVECRKDLGVLDETPQAYKDIDAVMAAQIDLVEVLHTLKAVLCVKG